MKMDDEKSPQADPKKDNTKQDDGGFIRKGGLGERPDTKPPSKLPPIKK